MLKPPFKLAISATDTVAKWHAVTGCCEAAKRDSGDTQNQRPRLADLDQHLHCSVIGTCLSTTELRKLMARFLFVRDLSDVELHHEAVSHASRGGPVTKGLQKLLDQRHGSAVRLFAKVHDARALHALWDEALHQGDVPGAYWAALTHRSATPALCQKVFGDVHMLSHLVGAANRADICRLVALERENAELRERTERNQLRSQELVEERDQAITGWRQGLAELRGERAQRREMQVHADPDECATATAQVVLQTERRERAEQALGAAVEETVRLRQELEHLGLHAQVLSRELAAAEEQLKEVNAGPGAGNRALDQQLRGRRLLYVGGRPSSTPAIRDLVLRHGGEFQRHDGGLEDRKGLLASGVAWAELVVFPVDCVDHDSAGNLKRLCIRQGVSFMPLRSASVASFAAALHGMTIDSSGPANCLKHG